MHIKIIKDYYNCYLCCRKMAQHRYSNKQYAYSNFLFDRNIKFKLFAYGMSLTIFRIY